MSAHINPVASTHVVTSTGAPSAANPITAAAVASSNKGKEVNSSTEIKNLADLKEKAPKMYDMMMQGIATTICNQMQNHQEKLKKLMREGQRKS